MYRIFSLILFAFLCIYVMACTKTGSFTVPFNNKTSSNTDNIQSSTPIPTINEGPSITNGAQLPNSNFDAWYSKSNYMEPGQSASNTIWATGNAGFKKGVSGASTESMPTRPTNGCNSNEKAALLTTREIVPGRAVGKGIASGNLFTGSFYIDPNAPLIPNDNQVRPIFGIPYSGLPIAFSFKYKYSPGTTLQNGKGEAVLGNDAMTAYVVLENRTTKPATRLAVGWFRSGTPQSTCKEQRVDIKYALYGTAPDDIQDYERKVLKYGLDGNVSKSASNQSEVIWGDTTTMKPTHIIVVFASSYQGDDFIGAPGSTLTVDDFKLIYTDDASPDSPEVTANDRRSNH